MFPAGGIDGLNDDVRSTNTNWCVQMFWFLLLLGVRARLEARMKQKCGELTLQGPVRCYGIRDVYASNKALWCFYRNVAVFSVPALSSRPISTLASVGASATKLTRSDAVLSVNKNNRSTLACGHQLRKRLKKQLYCLC